MWCIEFYDFGHWDEMSGTRRKYKAECVELANYLNKHTEHHVRATIFGGHRFRVRKVK